MLVKHSSCLVMIFKCRQESLSGPKAEELLHLTIACLSFSFEKGAH